MCTKIPWNDGLESSQLQYMVMLTDDMTRIRSTALMRTKDEVMEALIPDFKSCRSWGTMYEESVVTEGDSSKDSYL